MRSWKFSVFKMRSIGVLWISNTKKNLLIFRPPAQVPQSLFTPFSSVCDRNLGHRRLWWLWLLNTPNGQPFVDTWPSHQYIWSLSYDGSTCAFSISRRRMRYEEIVQIFNISCSRQTWQRMQYDTLGRCQDVHISPLWDASFSSATDRIQFSRC